MADGAQAFGDIWLGSRGGVVGVVSALPRRLLGCAEVEEA